jgi:hypothetical protein
VCDAKGYQIARWPIRDTLGEDFAFRSYFTGRNVDDLAGRPPARAWTHLDSEPKLSDSFLALKRDASDENTWVIAVSAPVWHRSKFQGVTGIFMELGELVSDPETAAATDKMLVFDARQEGFGNARLIHGQGKQISDIEPIDLNPFLSGEVGEHPVLGLGRWRTASKRIDQSSDPERGIYVVMLEEAATIEDPGKSLRANLVKIGLLVVGFAALVLSVVWIIILRRVAKT